jgi:hypothetical protein
MKKKCIFPVAVASIMLIPLLASAAGPLNRITYTASYNNNGLTIGTDTLGGVTYATVSYEGLYSGGEPGMPSLPIDYLKFSVPYNATNFTVTATTRWASQNLNYLVYPCQSPWMIGSPVPPIMLPDTSAYYSGNSYPSQMAWIADEGFLAGENHIVTVAVMPFRYTHSINADVLSRAKNCYVTLRYDLSDSLEMSPIVRNDSLLREEGYLLTQSMVVNPGQVKNFAPAQTINPGIDSTGLIQGGIGGNEINGGGYGGPEPIDSLLPPPGVDTTGFSTGELLTDLKYPYVIVTTPELKHAVRRIAALKRQKGYSVKVVTIDEVMHDSIASRGDYVNGHIVETDSAGVLRQYLRKCFSKEGTQFVLLVGDIPYRIISGLDFPRLTDLYFSDLSANWAYMVTDRFPELFVGRVPANQLGSNHVEQINNYTDKLFRYELNPGKGDYSYLGRALFSEGRQFSGYLDDVKDSLYSIYQNPVIINDYQGNNSNHPTGKDVIDALNSNPVGFISIFNHGDTARTRVYGSQNQVDNLFFVYANRSMSFGNGLNCLKTKNYPMIYYSPSCVTMPFDNKHKLSFGESFITGKDYGGPVYIGYTRAVDPYQGKDMATAFAKKIKDGYVKLGIATALSKIEYNLDTFEASFILGCFGDPEVELWTGIPQVYSDISIIRTDNSFIITGLPTEATIVAYLNKHFLVKTQNVMSSSITINDVLPNSPIMLYQHNYIPYIAPLILQNYNIKGSQYIITNELTAGNSIDSNRINGDVVVKSGAIYEVEASGIVRLEDGFKVEKGATFAVYPSCF